VFMLVFVMLRMYTKIVIAKQFGWEDCKYSYKRSIHRHANICQFSVPLEQHSQSRG
jgi:hypothetical protein